MFVRLRRLEGRGVGMKKGNGEDVVMRKVKGCGCIPSRSPVLSVVGALTRHEAILSTAENSLSSQDRRLRGQPWKVSAS
jgi:hypothetical protein